MLPIVFCHITQAENRLAGSNCCRSILWTNYVQVMGPTSTETLQKMLSHSKVVSSYM